LRFALARRYDDTTTRRFNALAPSALLTKPTKLTKTHKEELCESLRRIATADANVGLQADVGVGGEP